MNFKMKKAFTMVELIFVIVIIGILSAIAIPKFGATVDVANLAKAKSVFMDVMTSMGTERQKRILRGNFDPILDLGNSIYAFSDINGTELLRFPEKNCASGATGCWKRSVNGLKYVYYFAGSGDAKFKLENNRLVCDGDDADCNRILH